MTETRLAGLSLRKNIAWISMGEGVDLVSQWGLLAVLSKFMDVTAVGLFGLALAVIGPITEFCDLGLRKAQATDVGGEYRFGHYFSLRIVTSSVAFLVIVTIASTLGIGVYGWTVILLMALARAIEGQSDVFHGLFQLNSRMDFIARARMLRGPLGLTLFTAGIYFTGDQRVGSLGLIVAALTVLLLYDRRLGARLLMRPRPGQASAPATAEPGPGDAIAFVWNTRQMASLVRQVFPLGLVAVLGSLQMNIPRYSVELHQGMAALGYFTALTALYSASTRMANAMGHSAAASMAHGFAADARRTVLVLLAKLGILGLLLGAAGIAVVWAMGQEILTLIYAPEYAEYAHILLLLMVAAAFRHLGSMWQIGIIAARQFRVHLVQHVANIAVAAVASVLLIPPYGLLGAAFVLIAVAATNLVFVMAANAIFLRRLSG